MVEPDYIKWFRDNYPIEIFLFNEITTQVNNVFAKAKVEAEAIPIDLYQLKKGDDSSQLAPRDSAVIYYGVMVKTIIDIISKSLGSDKGSKLMKRLEDQAKEASKKYIKKNLPSIPIKHCEKCNYDNDLKDQYCGKCGYRL